MRKKIPSLITILLFILALFTAFDMSFELTPTARGATIYVPNDYPTIQEAIDAAWPGDTVYVYGGTYNENVYIDKNFLDLIGENRDTTIITHDTNAVTVAADWVTLSGFTFSSGNEGIYLTHVQNCEVSNNIVTNNMWGIYLYNSDWNSILGNNASSNNVAGIYLDGSSYNTITDNTASDNSGGGIGLYYSHGNTINSNTFSNSMNGFWLYKSDDNVISVNTLLSVGFGIELDDTTGNTLTGNTMIDHIYNGIFIEGSLLEHWNTHNIAISNTLNGKPIYYWKNQTGGSIPFGAGQVILANCTEVKIENQELNNSIVGIELAFSSNTTLRNNTILENHWGVIFSSSSNTTLRNNIILNNQYGVIFYSSVNNVFINCSIGSTSTNMFEFYGDSHATLINSTILWSGGNYFSDTFSTLTVKWYLQINVTDYLGNPVPNAKVNIKDNKKGSYDETFTTGIDGYVRWIPVTEYVRTYNGKTYYTPHRILAWNETLIGYAYPDPLINEGKTINVVLHNGTFLYLEPGWNLISLPRIQLDTNIQIILQSVEGRSDASQWYNNSDSHDHWKHYHVSKPSFMNDLQKLDHKIGFWLHITDRQGTTLVVFGNEPKISQSISLLPGWNLVGYPSLTNYNRTDGLNNLTFGSEVDSIWTYDAATQKWEEIGPLDYFECGKGYWIHAKTNCVWEVPL